MKRRLNGYAARLLRTLSLLMLLGAVDAWSGPLFMVLQRSALAGSQYYALGQHWLQIRVGDPLTLVREAANKHDERAIRVEWNGHKLGYLPRKANQVISAALDEGETLHARVAQLREHPDPWQRLELEVLIRL